MNSPSEACHCSLYKFSHIKESGCPQRSPILIWSTAKPTVPGFYWYKDRQGNRTVLHIRGAARMRVFYSEDKHEIPYDIENYTGQFAGPLIPPSEEGG